MKMGVVEIGKLGKLAGWNVEGIVGLAVGMGVSES